MADNVITIYFSMRGQTIGPGMRIVEQEKGNTQVAAEFVQATVGGELFEIVPDKAYPTDHMKLIDVAKQEQQRGERVHAKAVPADFAAFDTVFLGFPNWWARLPMPVVTFLEDVDLGGKRVLCFATSEGSGIGRMAQEVADIAEGADVDVDGALSLTGSRVGRSKKQIQRWAMSKMAS